MVAKRSHEAELRKHDKEVRHCHAYDEACAVAKHKAEVEDKKQTLAFCGVGSHHQNGKAENRIKSHAPKIVSCLSMQHADGLK